jgi:membrane-associated phospholipid phosphatase
VEPLDTRCAFALLRRAVFLYVFFIIVTCQGVFALLLVPGLDCDPRYAVWAIAAVIPLGLTAGALALEWRRHPFVPLPHQVLTAALLFGFWAATYFGIGAVIRPERVLRLSFAIDRLIPFEPRFVFLYVCVYPLFLLPLLRARDAAALHRLVLGYLLILAVSDVVYLLTPVAFDRPPVPSAPPTLAEWTLATVYRQDPPWNCLPSTHCAVALFAALSLREASRPLGLWAFLTAGSIGVSTTLTKQHYVIDVAAGFVLALAVYGALQWAWRALRIETWLAEARAAYGNLQSRARPHLWP